MKHLSEDHSESELAELVLHWSSQVQSRDSKKLSSVFLSCVFFLLLSHAVVVINKAYLIIHFYQWRKTAVIYDIFWSVTLWWRFLASCLFTKSLAASWVTTWYFSWPWWHQCFSGLAKLLLLVLTLTLHFSSHRNPGIKVDSFRVTIYIFFFGCTVWLKGSSAIQVHWTARKFLPIPVFLKSLFIKVRCECVSDECYSQKNSWINSIFYEN